MKKTILALIMLTLGLAVVGPAASEVIEEIVAIVNDDIITLSQYKQYHDSLVQMLRAQFQGEEFDKQYNMVKGQIINSMITDLLLLQAAKEKQLNVNEQVRNTIENLKKENNIESDAQLREELRRQGMDYEEFSKQIEDNMMRQAVVYTEVDRSIVLDESEIVSYYKLHPDEFTEPEEFKIRAIYLASEGQGNGGLETKREEISRKAGSGEDFAALAGEYSDSPLKENQGDLGHFTKGQLEKVLEEAVVKLKPGETTPWIHAKNGWYLMKLEEKKESRLKSFEEAKKEIENKLYQQKRNVKLEEFLKGLKEKSYIKILKPNPLNL
jgi:peptidyl-prolyl cis-trans isomerase SurA